MKNEGAIADCRFWNAAQGVARIEKWRNKLQVTGLMLRVFPLISGKRIKMRGNL
jgi:hypothetical protein